MFAHLAQQMRAARAAQAAAGGQFGEGWVENQHLEGQPRRVDLDDCHVQ